PAQARARRWDMRGGTVRVTAPVRGSTRRRSRRARGDSRSTSGAPLSVSSERAVDEVMFEIARFIFRNRPAAYRHARLVHRFPAAADQMVPPVSRVALRP